MIRLRSIFRPQSRTLSSDGAKPNTTKFQGESPNNSGANSGVRILLSPVKALGLSVLSNIVASAIMPWIEDFGSWVKQIVTGEPKQISSYIEKSYEASRVIRELEDKIIMQEKQLTEKEKTELVTAVEEIAEGTKLMASVVKENAKNKSGCILC